MTARRGSQPWGRGARGRSPAPRPAEEVAPRHGVLDLFEPADRSAVQDAATALAGARADVDDPVGAAHDVHVVLDHEQRVARAL